jgi:hypothetical protein
MCSISSFAIELKSAQHPSLQRRMNDAPKHLSLKKTKKSWPGENIEQ